jgi:hypothetical protein
MQNSYCDHRNFGNVDQHLRSHRLDQVELCETSKRQTVSFVPVVLYTFLYLVRLVRCAWLPRCLQLCTIPFHSIALSSRLSSWFPDTDNAYCGPAEVFQAVQTCSGAAEVFSMTSAWYVVVLFRNLKELFSKLLFVYSFWWCYISK